MLVFTGSGHRPDENDENDEFDECLAESGWRAALTRWARWELSGQKAAEFRHNPYLPVSFEIPALSASA